MTPRDRLLAPFRLRTVAIGVQVSLATAAIILLFHFLPGFPHHADHLLTLVLVALTVAGGLVVAALPWQRLLAGRAGLWVFYTWTAADILLISIFIGVTGGGYSEAFWTYGLTSIFIAIAYPPRGQAALYGITAGSYLLVCLLTGTMPGPAVLILRFGLMGLISYMAVFLARELVREIEGRAAAHAESARRSALLATVAAAAGESNTLDSGGALDAVLGAASGLGFDLVAITQFDDSHTTYRILRSRGVPPAIMAALQPATEGVPSLVLSRGATVLVEDYLNHPAAIQTLRSAGVRTAIGSPIRDRGRITGALLGGSRTATCVSRQEVEAFELLAIQAGRALENATLTAELRHRAFHDDLTGLPNRPAFQEALGHAISRAASGNQAVAVLLFDLDRFKTVNDTLGHGAGDALLQAVAARLSTHLRRGDLLARIGGDEFTVLLPPGATHADAESAAQRVLGALLEPFLLGGQLLSVTTSVGIALSGEVTATPEELLRRADLAMYQAKGRGGRCAVLFDEVMGEDARRRLELETDLRAALEYGGLRLQYQPVVAMDSGRVVAVEALVRWDHPVHGVISPATFIPLAEETGLIVPAGRWIMETACRQAALWRQTLPDAPRLMINVSPRQLVQEGFAAEVDAILKAEGLPAAALGIEVTESVLIEDTGGAAAALNALKRLGVTLGIDDFGTGYSSLSYLRRYPFDVMKLDRSFIEAIDTDPHAAALARSIIALGHTLGLGVVAEGIEHTAQARRLRAAGCELAQGYLFSRPLSARDCTALLLDAAAAPPFAALITPTRELLRPA